MNLSDNNEAGFSKISVTELKLPKGGGAIKGLGNSFQASLFSGAGSYSIPVPVAAARGFEPQLSLDYSSGAGNGIFGLGFSLSLSKVSVKTNKHIPRYNGTDVYELDNNTLVVQNSTADVPNPRSDNYEGQACQVTIYIPTVENSFSQIEHWQCESAGLSFWKVISSENTTSYYGIQSQIANPADAEQVFEWLIDKAIDNKGNQVVYNYVAENSVNVPGNVYELNRSNTANRYIHTIQYGNYFDESQNQNFAFTLVFNYGQLPGQNPQEGWICRQDPFSSYNSGFEIRTYRLCQGIQLVHDFPEELGDPLVVKELALTYENIQNYKPVQFQGMSMLTKVILSGFRKELSAPQAMPPLEFSYSAFVPPATPEFKMIAMGEGTIPGYFNATQFLPVDLNGEGLPGFLLSNNSMSLYLEPLGDGRYALPVANSSFPIDKNIKAGVSVLTDLDGNGQLELVVNSSNASGFYERTFEDEWNNFVPFELYPTVISDSRMEMVDLAGNGRNDLLLAETGNLQYYPSQGKKGYCSALNVPDVHDFPLIKPGYQQELVTFANMFGDGLSHRVRICNGSVESWPCLGYGKFGKKITFANAPLFYEEFDTSRLFLTDVDGSGTADLAYVYPDRVELFLNQSGNSFSDAIVVYLPEPFGETDQVSFTDILGNGTTCLVFTKIAPVPRHYYYNFSGEIKMPDKSIKQSLKPYLLNKIDNNMGSVSLINYCSSTKFILEDKLAGKPWVTKLPFPVQVVEEIVQYEKFSESRYVSKYSYHDGYYDPDKKQFMGFGFTESWDAETYEAFQAGYSNPDYPVAALNEDLFVPRVYTKSWYLNGAPTLEYDNLLAKYKSAYFNKDTDAYDFPDCWFSPDVCNSSEKTFVEAYKALGSKVLRTEVYALDGTADAANPYSVKASNYSVVLIQPAAEGRHAIFMVNPRESITYHYEREYTDPRVEQHFVLDTDLLCGQPRQACSVYLPRRGSQNPDYPEQYSTKAIITTDEYYNSPPDDFSMRLRGVKYREQTFDLLGLSSPPPSYFSFDSIYANVQTALQNVLPYMETPSGSLQAQQFGRTIFYFSDGDNVLPFRSVSPQLLVDHISTAEFTNNNITAMFGQRLTQDAIQLLGGYEYDAASGYWENNGLVQRYNNAQGFYLPSSTRSSLGTLSTVQYDTYYLAPVITTSYISITPPVTNVVTATLDYQAMAAKQQVDINGNVSQALFDALGQVIVTSLSGTENGTATGGVLLYPYNGSPATYQLRTTAPDGGPIDFESIIKNDTSREYYLQGAANFFYYDINACLNRQQPVCSVNLQRCNYAVNPGGATGFSCQTAIAYNDGLGQSLAAKMEAEPVDGSTPNWLVSGRNVYNNKGKVCESYLPYFSPTPFYQTQDEITSLGNLVPPPTITHYDPLLRTIRIDTPKGFFSKVEFTAWEQVHSDEDDTVTDSVYYINFMLNYPVPPARPTQAQVDEKNALTMAAGFYDTPMITVLDNMGNVIRTQQLLVDGGGTRRLTTFYALDIQGRKTVEIDPRLYESNSNSPSNYFSFKYQYSMSGKNPIVTDSADAKMQRHFSTIFDKQVWSLSPRAYCQVIYYDGLQRQTRLLVKKVPGDVPIGGFDSFNLVEQFTYGEEVALPGYNLRGQVYILKDLSGIVTNASYSMQGSVLQAGRQMTAVYKTAINWHNDVPLESGSCIKTFTYNALNLLLSETVKDNDLEWNTTTNTYNLEGLLNSISLTNNGVNTLIIKSIIYDANRQRSQVVYGNNVTTGYRHEASTLRLTGILSQAGTLPPLKMVQDITYTYDPVGNITCTRDASINTVFNSNQKIDPVFNYRYDSLYRLTQAKGRQHAGITSGTYKNNIKDGSFMQCIFSQSPVNDTQALENYTENYTYDDSGNLTEKQHLTASPVSTWNVGTAVLKNCNRLQGLYYDDSGNQGQLAINNLVSLSYNCCENLVSAAVIERPDEANDSDYYVYASTEQRTRKVSEQYISDTSSNYTDTIYFGNYEIQRKGLQASDGQRTVTNCRQTLRIMDGTTCVAVLYHWITGGPNSTKNTAAPDQLRYQMSNNLGSVAVELDEQGLLVSYEEYFPYGGTSFIAGPNEVDVSLKTYRYSGKECDNSTGLYYYGMRYYVSWLGRWLNPDPAGTVDGLNLFAFVGGGPISKIDNTGGFGVWAALKGAAVVTGAALLSGVSTPVIVGAALVSATLAGTIYDGRESTAAATMTDIRQHHRGEFGIAYSTLNWKGVFKGFKVTSPSSWVKTTKKMFEDGHATSIYVSTRGTVSTTGMSDDGYVVSRHREGGDPFLRDSESTDTSFYFHSEQVTAEKFDDAVRSLKGRKATYSELKPNLPFMDRTENCISSSHQFSYELGKESVTATKGWWIPSVANHAMRLKSLPPGSKWSHTTVNGVSTHIP